MNIEMPVETSKGDSCPVVQTPSTVPLDLFDGLRQQGTQESSGTAFLSSQAPNEQ